jgi:hypothetical protein
LAYHNVLLITDAKSFIIKAPPEAIYLTERKSKRFGTLNIHCFVTYQWAQ